MKLTDLLRRTAEANPQAATLHSIADKAEELVEKRYSVRRMLREMESFAHDTEAMRLTVDALRQLPYLPTLEQRDYKPYMALVACSPENFAYCYLSNDLVTRVRDNILKSKEQKNIQPTKGGHKMVTCQNYVSLFYRQITSCPSDGGIS